MEMFDLLERVREVSPAASNALFNRVIPRLIPLAGGLGVKVRECAPTRAVLTMPLSRKTKNHLGGMYFGAQMTLADLTVGVLLFSRFPPHVFGGVIRRVEADFVAKGKGDLRCVAELPGDVEQEMEQARSNESGKAEGWVPMELFDPGGKVVTRVRTLVAIKRYGA